MDKNKYKVLNTFRWSGHWREKDEELEMLPCEATALVNAGFIAPVTAKTTKAKQDATE
jgi:hypothetical protein